MFIVYSLCLYNIVYDFMSLFLLPMKAWSSKKKGTTNKCIKAACERMYCYLIVDFASLSLKVLNVAS